MSLVIWLLTFGVDFIFPILGIIGYFAGIRWLITTAIIFIAYSSFFQHLSIITFIAHIVAAITGLIVALIANLPVIITIELAICIEWLILNIITTLPMFFIKNDDK